MLGKDTQKDAIDGGWPLYRNSFNIFLVYVLNYPVYGILTFQNTFSGKSTFNENENSF